MSTQRRKVELWARNVREFCQKLRFHVTFRDLLHAVKLRHGTDGFTSTPKEGVLRIFFCPKNPTASAGYEPANLGTKGQHATSRPPKPLNLILTTKPITSKYVIHSDKYRQSFGFDPFNKPTYPSCNLFTKLRNQQLVKSHLSTVHFIEEARHETGSHL